ncbi:MULTISPECIES: helix-turn-helix domain-containing protein [Mycobacteriaceae]|uniref:Helix-turn-helix transcriptional regulator n=1 Tax=Mycobacterium servetii TaxID=3237418 RepID=A0ABV4BZK6_9MYCO|nr:helix-turn-helix transcriptional regulator [Mycolicibacter icosiumassiliensis]
MARSNGDKPPVAYVARGLWPNAAMTPDAPPSASAAQHLARALGAAMAETATGQRALAVVSGVAHTTIGRILAGTVLCDIGSLARLEHALGRRLWPEHPDAATHRRLGGKPHAHHRDAV